MSADLFSDLGLAAGVAAAAEAAGFDTPSAIQEAAIPVLRRGNNMVVVGAPGSGARTAILLAMIDRLVTEGGNEVDEEDEDGAAHPRVLVLTPTADEAARAARTASRLGASSGVRARSLDRPEAWAATAVIACASAPVAVEAVRGSALKLDRLMAIVVDGLDGIRALGHAEAVDTLFAQLPAEAQRVVRASTPSDALDDFAQRALRRAMRVPARPADAKGAPAAAMPLRGVELQLFEVPAAGGHDALAMLAARGPVRIHFRSSTEAAAAARELTTRGFELERLDATVTVPDSLPAARDVEPLAVSFGTPADATALGLRHADGGALIVDPRELSHARALAAETGVTLRLSSLGGVTVDSALDTFRAEVRRALDEEDLSSQMLVLEPLLQDHPPAEVAAALSALLRARRPAAGPVARASRGTEAGAPPPARSWTRLYIGIGKRDDVRAGDLVGAITGEANVSGDVVGKIDLRDNFSVVEVETGAAQHVIDSLNGRTLKGRAMRVDYDRRGESDEAAGGRTRSESGERGPRGEGGRGPRGGGGRAPRSGGGGGGGGRAPRGGGDRPQRGGGRGGPRRGPGGGAPRDREGGREGGRDQPGRSGGPGRGPQGPRRGPPRDRDPDRG